MSVPDVLKYIQENKSNHSVDDLIIELKNAGYPDEEIQGAIKQYAKMPERTLRTVESTPPKLKFWGKAGRFVVGMFLGMGMYMITLIGLNLAAGWLILPDLEQFPYYPFIPIVVDLIFVVAVPLLVYLRIRKKFQYAAMGMLTIIIISIFMSILLPFALDYIYGPPIIDYF